MLHPERPVKRPMKDILPTLNALGYFSAAQRIQCYWKKEVIAGKEKWWSRLGSNQRPPQCHCGALPTELRPHQRDGDCMDSP